MSKKITGAEYPLSKIFSSDFDYVIPPYQRPYAWTTDQAGELFDDLYGFFDQEPDDSYFLGSIVLIKDETKPHAKVVDGQQRLTTLTILLSVIASKFTTELRDGFLKYIREPGNPFEGLSSKPRLALRERDKTFFAEYVQALKFDILLNLESKQLDNESQRNIKENSNLLLTRIEKYFESNQIKLVEFGAFLVGRCFLVTVSTPSEQSAFRVFSVLNSRGLDLLHTDIIKSNVIGRVSKANEGLFNEKWEDLEVRTGRKDFELLFGHIRMIYAKTKAKRSLLEEFQTYVITGDITPEDLFSNVIEPFAEAYLIAKNAQYVSTTNAAEINNLLNWLNRIDNSDWLPSAILFVSQKMNEPNYIEWFIKKLERLAAYLHVTAKNVNERIERYSKVISDLENPHSIDTPVNSIELTLLEKNEMLDALNRDIYLMSARKRNYIILRLDSFVADGAAIYDPSLLTIEHVLPQTVDALSEWSQTWPNLEDRNLWVHRIANLLPLTQKRNSQAQNYDFQTKKTAYFGGRQGVSSYALTTQVLNMTSWTPEVIKTRQKELLEVFAHCENWNLEDSTKA